MSLEPPRRDPRERRASPRDYYDDYPRHSKHRPRDISKDDVRSPSKSTRMASYDASDEEDDHRRPRANRSEKRAPRSSKEEDPIPPPPIGRHSPPGGDDEPRRRRPSPSPMTEATSRHKPSHRDAYGEPPPRRKDTVRDYAREEDAARRRRHRERPSPVGEDSEYEAPPRSSRRHRERAREDDRGYKSEAPGRHHRDEYERGYRTDGRDYRRHRHRDEDADVPPRRDHERRERRHRDDERERPPPPSSRPRDDEQERPAPSRARHSAAGAEDYDRPQRGGDRRDRRPSNQANHGFRGKLNGPGMKDTLQKGQKHWKTVEPVAKPLLTSLAKAYLEK